jgi:hypothetical protein
MSDTIRNLSEPVLSLPERPALDRLIQATRAMVPPKELYCAALKEWNNGKWPLGPGPLLEAFQHISTGARCVLECGAGLSTLILAAFSSRFGTRITALEDKQEWFDLVSSLLRFYRLEDSAEILFCPLAPRDGYHWYQFDPAAFPATFDLFVCDGPPGGINGSGRKGLLTELGSYVSDRSVLLLDDCHREAEREQLIGWAAALNRLYEIRGPDLTGKCWGKIPPADSAARSEDRE